MHTSIYYTFLFLFLYVFILSYSTVSTPFLVWSALTEAGSKRLYIYVSISISNYIYVYMDTSSISLYLPILSVLFRSLHKGSWHHSSGSVASGKHWFACSPLSLNNDIVAYVGCLLLRCSSTGST